MWIVIIAFVILGGGIGGYFAYAKKKKQTDSYQKV